MWKGLILNERKRCIEFYWILLGTIDGPWKCESNVSLQPEALAKAKAGANQSIEPVNYERKRIL